MHYRRIRPDRIRLQNLVEPQTGVFLEFVVSQVTDRRQLLFIADMTHSSNIDDCVIRVQAGDLDAFVEIVRQCERKVRAWVVSRCPPGGDADDVAQKTFIEAFRRIDEYEPRTDFRAWLFAIARFQLLAETTRLKRLTDYHSRYAPVALSHELERRIESSTSHNSERLDHLESCLESVDGPLREILDWRYADELPLAEIADRTNRSVGAIKKQLFVLRQKLHECIQRKMSAEAAS